MVTLIMHFLKGNCICRYQNLYQDLSPMTRQVLASQTLKEAFDEGEGSASLKTRYGPRLEVKSKDVKEETAVFTKEMMDRFRTQIHMSKRNALKTARFFKEVFNGLKEVKNSSYFLKNCRLKNTVIFVKRVIFMMTY